jgi:hypothetical protein
MSSDKSKMIINLEDMAIFRDIRLTMPGQRRERSQGKPWRPAAGCATLVRPRGPQAI